MPIVGMPDGTQVQFPDEMPPAQIKGLIASKFPKETQQLSAPPSPPLSGWTPSQVQELNNRVAAPPAPPSLANAFQQAFNKANNDPLGALSDSASKIAQSLGMPEAWANRLGRDVNAGIQATGPLGVAEVSPAALMPQEAATIAAPEVVPAAQRIGVDIPKAAVGGPITQNIAQKVSDIPFVGTPLETSSQKAINQLGQAATNAEQGYGSGSVPSAGEAVRKGITSDIQKASKDKVKAEYDKIDSLVNPNATAPLPETTATLVKINNARNAAALGPSKATSLVDAATLRPGGLTYAGIKQLRTSIGEMLDTGPLPADMSGGELKQIYGSLSQDLRGAVKTAGGDKALAQFERANNYAKLTAANNERLATILGAKSDEGLVDRVLSAAGSTSRADIDLLSRARKAVDPSTWDELASASISKLGRDPQGNFSPTRFLTAWGKLTPAGKQTLFRSTGKGNLANILDDIATVSSRFDAMNRYANTSKTGAAVATGAVFTGLIHAPLATLATLFSGRVMAHMLSKPATASAVRDFLYAVQQSRAQRKVAAIPLNRASKVLGLRVATELNIPQLAPRITQELQGLMPGYPSDQNSQ